MELALPTTRTVRVRIPVRVDFAGGWTDVHYFSAREGGAVLSGAIDHHVEGLARRSGEQTDVRYRVSVPTGSGLGTSAALDVAWLALTNGLIGRGQTPVELAEAAYRVEKLLGVEGGKQDQYAAALGGFNFLVFGPEDKPARVERLELDPRIVRSLEERLVLCYTGTARHSGSLHERIWSPFLDGDRRVVAALREIRDTAVPARDAVVAGDLERLAELMTINREAARRLLPGIVTPGMDELFQRASAAGAIGSKPCGAGGGGCLLFVCAAGSVEGVRQVLSRAGGRLLPLRFEPVSRW